MTEKFFSDFIAKVEYGSLCFVASKFWEFLNYRNRAARAAFESVIFRGLYVFEKVFLKKNFLCSDRGFIRDRP